MKHYNYGIKLAAGISIQFSSGFTTADRFARLTAVGQCINSVNDVKMRNSIKETSNMTAFCYPVKRRNSHSKL
jgi:hypothetical protein